jgi:hypothetical protein
MNWNDPDEIVKMGAIAVAAIVTSFLIALPFAFWMM